MSWTQSNGNCTSKPTVDIYGMMCHVLNQMGIVPLKPTVDIYGMMCHGLNQMGIVPLSQL